MNKLSQLGQSSIEFIIIFSFTMGFFIVFLGLGLNFTTGYLVHYATYDISRAYLVGDGGNQSIRSSENYKVDEYDNGIAYGSATWSQVFNSGILRMRNASGFQVNSPGDVVTPEFIGVTFSYQRRLSDSGFITGLQEVEYVSESFLGKEPVRAECLRRICTKMNGNCQSNVEVTAFDNGC